MLSAVKDDGRCAGTFELETAKGETFISHPGEVLLAERHHRQQPTLEGLDGAAAASSPSSRTSRCDTLLTGLDPERPITLVTRPTPFQQKAFHLLELDGRDLRAKPIR